MVIRHTLINLLAHCPHRRYPFTCCVKYQVVHWMLQLQTEHAPCSRRIAAQSSSSSSELLSKQKHKAPTFSNEAQRVSNVTQKLELCNPLSAALHLTTNWDCSLFYYLNNLHKTVPLHTANRSTAKKIIIQKTNAGILYKHMLDDGSYVQNLPNTLHFRWLAFFIIQGISFFTS